MAGHSWGEWKRLPREDTSDNTGMRREKEVDFTSDDTKAGRFGVIVLGSVHDITSWSGDHWVTLS